MDSLLTRLPNLPLILTGPILRRVTPKSVTVWVALKQSANVTLMVRSGDPAAGVIVGYARQPTVAIGEWIHMVAVTVSVSLVPGVVYTYNMLFDGPSIVPQMSLLNAIKPKASSPTDVPYPISYPPYDLPSFSLPPSDPNDLRIIHGSCRMPHGTGPDALSLLDELIRVTVQNAAKRPHQLLMTGDQIYADDVAAVLLLQLMDASTTLLGVHPAPRAGWRGEELLWAKPGAVPIFPSDFPPLLRTELLGRGGAGFTSADLRNHLMSFGEYLCMYLFTWSDVLWPKTLPTSDEIASAAAAKKDVIASINPILLAADASKVPGDLDDVNTFMKTLPKVRRALANIPSYMICDDHDVTDDWNMTPAFCDRVYASLLGRRIVQNALVAYALCQLWGNTPEQFEFDSSNKPAAGRQLLTIMDKITAVDYDLNSESLQNIVGVHTADQINARTPESVFHDQTDWLRIGAVDVSANSLVYNFTYEGPAHQIVVTDTRSWRAYSNRHATADLLPPDQITAQIPLTPATGNRVLIVVLTTNAPPVQPIRGATRHDTISTVGSAVFQSDAHPDIFESWEIPSLSFDRLLKQLTDKLGPDQSVDHYGQVILLSGDVHHAFATRLVYRATNRYGDLQPKSASVVFAQLVASSFKKQNEDTVGFQRDGYFYVPHGFEKWLIHRDMTEGYVGWNVPHNFPPYAVGSRNITTSTDNGDTTDNYPIRRITIDDPTIQVYPVNAGSSAGTTVNEINLTLVPHYRYRLDYLTPQSQSFDSQAAAPIPAMLGPGVTQDKRKAAMETFNAATGHYREHNSSAGKQKVIGRNCIGEVTFDWHGRDSTGDRIDHKKVNHTVRWRFNPFIPGGSVPDPDFPLLFVVSTTFTVSLDPNDKAYKDKTATTEAKP